MGDAALWRAAPLATGVVGGSGTHIVQIVIVIAVAALLIGYFLLRLLGRGSDAGFSAAPGPVSQRDRDINRAPQGRAGDGTVRLERRWTALAGTGGNALVGGNTPITMYIDGAAVGEVAPRETVDVAVEPGHHTLRLRQGKHRSPERSFDIAADEVVSFYCHGPRYGWPQLLAALVKTDLWITLRRV